MGERQRRISGKKRKKTGNNHGSKDQDGENQDENGNDNDNDDDGDDNFGEGSGAAFDGEQLFTMSFVKKFIHYAKNRFKPKLTDEARGYIATANADMRQSAAGSKTL